MLDVRFHRFLQANHSIDHCSVNIRPLRRIIPPTAERDTFANTARPTIFEALPIQWLTEGSFNLIFGGKKLVEDCLVLLLSFLASINVKFNSRCVFREHVIVA